MTVLSSGIRVRAFVTKTLLSGLLVLAPVYLAILLLAKATKSLMNLVQPLEKLLPDWLPAADRKSVV